jgi:iron(III) transport system permease protein
MDGTTKKPNWDVVIQTIAVMTVLLLVLLPIVFLLVGSFYSAPPGDEGHFTLDNYIRAFNVPWFYSSTMNSLNVAILSSIFACILGIFISWVTVRTNMPFRRQIEYLAVAPLFLSPFMGAIAWHLLANKSVGILNKLSQNFLPFMPNVDINSMTGIAFVIGIYHSSYIYLFVSGALKSMDPSLEEAAIVSGASHFRTTMKVTLPLMLPAILSGILLVFVLAAEQFVIPAVLGWGIGFHVLTTRIYSLLSMPPINYGLGTVLCIILILITGIGVYFYRKATSYKKFVTITGKGFRPHVLDIGKAKYVALAFCILYVLITFFMPLVVIVLNSFSRLTGYYYPFTLMNYEFIFTKYPMFWLALKNSMLVSIVGATICMILATITSWVIHRTKFRFRSTLDYLSTIPISIPGLVLGVGLLWAWIYVDKWTRIGVYGTLWLLIIACISRFITYGVRSTSSSLLQIAPELEESASICGSSWLNTVWKIVIPLLKPGILAGWTLLFVVFFREVSMVILLYSSTSVTLSIILFELWQDGIFPQLCALGVVQIVIIGVLVLIFNKVFKTKTGFATTLKN